MCSCNPGFFPVGDGSVCQGWFKHTRLLYSGDVIVKFVFLSVDINECSVNNGGCLGDLICSNTPGSFECGCQSGFIQDGTTCTGWLLEIALL